MQTDRSQAPPGGRLFAALAAAALLLPALEAHAQKKGTTSPPPPGAVFFDMGTIHGIKADGTAVTNSSLPSTPPFPDRPSSLAYGDDPVNPLKDRWFLRFEEVRRDENDRSIVEVIARHPSGRRVQVTNFQPGLVFSTSAPAEWSNDGADSFISIPAFDVTFSADGTATVHAASIVKLRVTGADVDAAGRAGTHLNVTPLDEQRVDVAYTPAAPQTAERHFGGHHWSPDGTRVVYQLGTDVEVAHAATGAVTTVFSSPNGSSAPRWSPVKDATAATYDRVAFTSGRDVFTVRADGAGGPAMLLDGTLSEAYTHALWSADGAHVAFRMIRASGFNRKFYIARVPAAGGSYTVMTGALGTATDMVPLGWVP